MTAMKALAPFVHTDDSGARWLAGFRCRNCGEILLESRAACPKCAEPGALVATKLQPAGRLHSFTIVHRSFPGIATPFVSAIVQLDGGGFVRGNVVGIEPRPELMQPGLRVRVAYEEIVVESMPGERFLRHVFVPEATSASAGVKT